MNNSTAPNFITRLTRFLAGGGFPTFALFLLFFYEVFVAAMIFSPPANGPWGDLVEEFRLRCFALDPKSGAMNWGSAWVMLSEPIPLVALIYFIWRSPLREFWKTRRGALAPLGGVALAVVTAIGVSLLGLGRARASVVSELPFPADRLRSSLPMPSFTMTNQDGVSVSLGDFKGRIVLVTAVYSTCTTTCPMMLNKIKSVLNELTPAERDQLVVVAFSLKPETDTRELRDLTSKMYGMKSPQFHFVSGVPSEVNALLDDLSVARTRDEKTGQIMHSNLFFLLGRDGRIAYRLSLSQREQSWLASAVRTLIREEVASL